jgi:hypothetical protein
MVSVTSNEPTRKEIYEKVKGLLKTYYALLNKGSIELALEEYSLNGREIIGLFEEIVEFTDTYALMENNLNTAKEDVSALEGKLKNVKKFKEKLETIISISDGITRESQKESLKKLSKDLSDI